MVLPRRFVPHVLALASLVACAGARSTEASARPASGAGGSRCADARSAARRVLASVQACGSDLDCVPFHPGYLGCDGVRSVAAPEPLWEAAALVDACTGVGSRALSCPGAEPACVAGRCRSQVWPGACRPADEALRAAVATGKAPACGQDDDCGEVQLGWAAYPVARTFGETARSELSAYRQACGRSAFEAGRRGGARCAEGVCSTERPRPDAPCAPSRFVKPRAKDPGCVGAQVSRRLGAVGQRPTGRHLLKFLVGPDGRPGLFEAETPAPPDLMAAMVSATLACEFEGGRDACGQPTAIWMILPLDFGN